MVYTKIFQLFKGQCTICDVVHIKDMDLKQYEKHLKHIFKINITIFVLPE